MVLRWLLGLPEEDDLTSDWEALGAEEHAVFTNQDANAYQDFKGHERELQARQHDKDVDDAFSPPKFD